MSDAYVRRAAAGALFGETPDGAPERLLRPQAMRLASELAHQGLTVREISVVMRLTTAGVRELLEGKQ